MQEMIANAENWNLAGDVGLLNSLKAFADVTDTKKTYKSIQNDFFLEHDQQIECH